MSVVIGIKENGVIYLGADSQVTCGWGKSTLSNKNNFKIWEVKKTKNILMGSVGLVRESNVISITEIINEIAALKKEVNFEYVVKFIVPALFSAVKASGVVAEKDGIVTRLNNDYLLAAVDKLFLICSDGCVIEIDDYATIGSGADYATSVLQNTLEKPPKERIIAAINATAKNHIYVDLPIVIADTKNMKFEII